LTPVTAGGRTSPARRLWRSVLDHAGRAYLAGPDLAQALAVADALRTAGHATTLCYWHAEDEPTKAVAAQVMATVAAATQRHGTCDVAVKAPGLGLDGALIGEVARACRDGGVRLWFDSHGTDVADTTLALATGAAAQGADVGVAVPARWRRSALDLVRAREVGLWVRLVKGQWPDGEPVDGDVGERFLSLLHELAGSGRAAVASHDTSLLEHALGDPAEATCSGRPAEVQLLHSVPSRGAVALAADRGVPVRFYVPFGHPSLVYSPRNVWENRRIAWWLARDVVRAARPVS
jgi:proline dehydrogenase